MAEEEQAEEDQPLSHTRSPRRPLRSTRQRRHLPRKTLYHKPRLRRSRWPRSRCSNQPREPAQQQHLLPPKDSGPCFLCLYHFGRSCVCLNLSLFLPLSLSLSLSLFLCMSAATLTRELGTAVAPLCVLTNGTCTHAGTCVPWPTRTGLGPTCWRRPTPKNERKERTLVPVTARRPARQPESEAGGG